MSGIRAFDRQPVASTTYFAVTVLPSEVVTDQRLVLSSNAALFDAGVELDIGAQIEAVGDVVGVFQNLRLRRVALAPVPFLLQFVGERIGILHALDVAARAGIAVPVPGAADAAALLVDPRRQSHARAAGAACTCRQSPRRPRRRRRPGGGFAGGGWRADMDRDSLQDFLSICRSAFSPAAPKRKRQIGGPVGHFVHGMVLASMATARKN